jgi:hypothetical protein
LRVVLPDAGRPAFVAARMPACTTSRPAFMSVQPVQERAGSGASRAPASTARSG